MITTYELAVRQASGRTADVDTALIAQKNHVWGLVSAATDADNIREAYRTLTLFAPLWKALDYGYKVREVATAAINRAYQIKGEAEDMRDNHCSRRPAQKRGWDNEVKALDYFITELCVLRS